MAQPQTDSINQMLDPFGIWKTTRDATLETWSKMMIDLTQSEAYTRSTGMMLDQTLGLTQPMQDAIQRMMTFTLAYLNMPTREEVTTLAGRLTNIETRLDDLDAKTSDMRDDGRKGFHAIDRRTEQLEARLVAREEAVDKELRSVDRNLDKMLSTLLTRLERLEAALLAAHAGSAPPPAPEPEPGPRPKK